MLKEELMEKALTLVQVPDDYQLYIEEYDAEDGAMFTWGKEEQDEGISISLDSIGNLTDLSIEKTEDSSDSSPLPIEVGRKRAEEFLLLHYPYAFNYFSFYKTEKLSQAMRFHYEQIVMDLPLDEPGCIIDVDLVGNIVKFCFGGVKEIPEIPRTLISKEKLIEEIQNNLNLQLKIKHVFPGIYDVQEEELRLVYEPEQSFMKYKADFLTPTLTIQREEEGVEKHVPLPTLSKMNKEFTNKELIGITDQMDVIREVDMGTETGIVWRNRNWKPDENDLSIDGFFQRHTEDTVKAFISKKSGKVKSFIWFNERQGDLELSREACYLKAIEFLQTIIPEYYQYLQLIVRGDEDEEEDADFKKELFLFDMHNGDGISIDLSMIITTVNRTTGNIDHFGGPNFDIEQLNKIPTRPGITQNEASKIFNDHLDFRLVWNKDYDSETESYILAYEACNQKTKTPIRYIDAMTGTVISDI